MAAIAVITTVLGFMSMVLANFPTVETNATSIEETTAEGFSVEAVKKATDGFHLAYISVIESLTSYMDDPDYHRAEQGRLEMVAYAEYLLPQFQELTDTLQNKLQP